MRKKQKLSKISSSVVTTMDMKEHFELNRDREVWLKHYSSNHQILLVGEGDFSFSCSLATRFGSASNICASSLDSYADDVVRKYKKASSNLKTLKRLGASLLHGVDATKLKQHTDLNCRRYDRVIFNFPHAGFHGKESDSSLIRKHRGLVFGFFQGASRMLRANGEIHVAHKNKAPFCHWNLEELANKCSLVLKQCVAFDKKDYPGYENKRGDGSRCDRTFILGDCSTFKFHVAKELYTEKLKWRQVKGGESKRECTKRVSRVSSEIHSGELGRISPRERTRFPYRYTKESPERHHLLCQTVQAN
ncbi:unnamed protein product [Eruca vesicaria subsp. sativa]|uniref:25S rRNA (uridine-N(3))-methyltransferase BMT5-like domain-containing protein n=1 Tax=Eruca vesicaria subsp. sativa TaxID=29727 RepID=A0ABC8JYK8_ERUVS|nr:unnamed protein product [Eruca vesicaria subsp. sativa]